ncbi:MAG: alpha-hydroxy-acid oxidizing protein [Lachnospiraceae bacterium]|nr:alpha-hydroxy-acid oxidizing protein [Lachnospiraceae bacterium]
MGYTRKTDANEITQEYMDSILVKARYIDSVVADTSVSIFGRKYSMPVVMPAFSHLGVYNGRQKNGLEEYSLAAKECEALNFCGMMENEMFQKIIDTGADTVRIVKPYADHGKILDQMQFAEAAGAVGIGMDIDHIFGEKGADIVVGEEMASQTKEMLQSYVELTKLPFVVKGVLSVTDAVKCAAIGAKAIIVSHHHGRIPYAVPPLMILPQIKEALQGKDVQIIVDCGIASGADVFKALALGADAAAVGRAMLPSLEKDGTEGLAGFLRTVEDELRYMMSCCGFAKPADIDDSVLCFWRRELNGK